jgi:hypothetical protein
MQFEWKKYEAANTPLFTESQQALKQITLNRVLTNPDPVEIISGAALNEILPYFSQLANKGIQGPPIPLSPEILDRINVTTPNSGGSVGLLKNGGYVDFPLVLRGPTQKELGQLLPQAVSGVVSGSLDLQLYKQCRTTLEKLREEHRKNFHKEEIDGQSFLVGSRFLDNLESSVKLLEDPNAGKLFAGNFHPKGSNVAELVQNMTQQGLRFAPALAGDESAYLSLNSSLTAFAAGAHDSSGFHVGLPPSPRQVSGKKGS